MNSPIGCAVVLLCFVPAVVGYSSGAPTTACGDMVPRHGVPAKDTNTSPYTITLSAQSYRCNEAITVTLAGTTSFKGFFCQPRPDVSSTTTTGTLMSMTQSPTTSKCDASVAAITQGDASDKTSVQFKWTPAGNESAVIVCTFVQTKAMFWVQQASGRITYSGCAAPPSPTSPADPTTSGPITTTGNGGSSVYGSGHLLSQLLSLVFCVLICFIVVLLN